MNTHLKNSLLVAWLAICFSASTIHAQDSQDSPESNETITVERGDLEMIVNLPGIFVADDKDEIKMEPSKYKGDLIVTKIMKEGAFVKEGDVLIEFETDKVDDAIEEAQNEATDANVELKKAQAELESAKIDLDTKIAHANTEQKHLELAVAAATEKQLMELENKEKEIEDAERQQARTLEDFETLKNIYEDREIQNSPSGNILFDREKKKIVNGEKRVALLKKELEYFKKFEKSKEQLEKELEVDKKKAEIKKQKISLEAAVTAKQGVVDKAQRKMDAATRKVEGLQDDQKNLRVTSPREGVLFYGTTGQEMPAGVIVFGGMGSDIRKELRIGGRVQTHRILLTIAKMDQLSIKMSVSEDDIQHLNSERSITVYPDAFPTEKFSGKLTKVDQVATKVGFTSSTRRFKVMGKCTDEAPQLRSGMSCRVAIHCDAVKDAVLIPVTAVFADDQKFVCYVKGSDDPEMREVEIGYSNAEFVQITSGLDQGDEIYLQRPASHE